MFEAFSNFIGSFLISAMVIAALIPLSRRLGWLDKPDARKQHPHRREAASGCFWPSCYRLLCCMG